MQKATILQNQNLKAIIYNGQIVSLKYEGHEFMHSASLPKDLRNQYLTVKDRKKLSKSLNLSGWNLSGIEMFPKVARYPGHEDTIIGEKIVLDTHGISRHLEYQDIKVNQSDLLWQGKQIHHGNPIKNTKYDPKKGNPEELIWPFKYSFLTTIKLTKTDDKKQDIIHKNINLTGDKQPYQIGSHPAFAGPNNPHEGIFLTDDSDFNLNHVIKNLGRFDCYQIPNCSRIKYIDIRNLIGFEFISKGYGNLGIWSPKGKNGEYTKMFCIEPESNLEDGKKLIESNSNILKEAKNYSYSIRPFIIKK